MILQSPSDTCVVTDFNIIPTNANGRVVFLHYDEASVLLKMSHEEFVRFARHVAHSYFSMKGNPDDVDKAEPTELPQGLPTPAGSEAGGPL